jgi:cadmium resistance protein CadD (predicted permease)
MKILDIMLGGIFFLLTTIIIAIVIFFAIKFFKKESKLQLSDIIPIAMGLSAGITPHIYKFCTKLLEHLYTTIIAS